MYFPDDVDFSVSAITNDDDFSQTDSLTLASEGGGVSVRQNIRQTVEDIRVLDQINEKDKRNEWLAERSRGVTERCLVCTLIYGTCEHTREWVDLSSPSWTRPPGYLEQQLIDEDLDDSIDDILNVVGELKIDTKPVLDDIDISTMQWNALEQLLSDKIGSTDLCLFAPDERGWQSTVSLNPKLIVVFGGFKYKVNKVPQPFTSVTAPHEVEYLNDVRAYDLDNTSWHGLRAGSSGGDDERVDAAPPGRYGHIAAAIGRNRMLVFGGRGAGGLLLSDTWLYLLDEDTWQPVRNNEALDLPVPSPRVFSACCAVRVPSSKLSSISRSSSSDSSSSSSSSSNSGSDASVSDVYLFGGTDGIDNCGDLWVFRGDPSLLQWERLVAVGLPPCPRYGHQMVALSEDESGQYGIRGRGQQLMVLGGCHVSPQGEVVGSNLSPAEVKQLMLLSSELRKRYKDENRYAETGGSSLEASVFALDIDNDNKGSSGEAKQSLQLSAVLHQAASMASVMHSLEQHTRTAETAMVDSYKISQAQLKFNVKKSRHGNPQLDMYLFSVQEAMWRTQDYPPIRGAIPTARMHFGAACIGPYVFVMGGVEPTSLTFRHVEATVTAVHALDLKTLRWEAPDPINSSDHLKGPLRIAEADVIRALKRCDEEKLRGFSLGALNGKTVELCEAQAVLEVCRWRQSMLHKEQAEQSGAPAPRWGANLLRHGQRLFYVGGWSGDAAVLKGSGSSGSTVMVLNVEQEYERRRRLEDEYKARLERFRIKEQAEANMANVQSVYELRAMKAAELRNMTRERKMMTFEDFRSAIPPLSRPDPVQLVQASDHCLWVTWKRIVRNSNEEPIDPESIVYFLYIRVGFESLAADDRVYATLPPAAPPKKKPGGGRAPDRSGSTATMSLHDSPAIFFADQLRRFPAEITHASGSGEFDLLFDDGTVEKNVPRRRLKKAQRLEHFVLSSLQSSGRDDSSSSSYSSCYADLSTVLAEAARTTASQSGTIVASLPVSLSVRQRFEGKLMARDRMVEKLRRLSGRDAVEDRLKERQAHLDRLDLMKGIKGPSTKKQQQQGHQARRSMSGDHSSSSFSSASYAGREASVSSIITGETLLSFDEEEEEDYEIVRYRDYFSNRDFQGLTSRSGVDSMTASSSSSSSSPLQRRQPSQGQNACQLTVQMDSRWQLVYVGNENSYACSHLVPSDVLSRELDISVPVQLCVQVLGADHPMYERSQPSAPVMFFTKSPRSMQPSIFGAATSPAAANNNRPSKLKREILSAVVRDQQQTDRFVKIEKPSPHECCSRGFGENYL